MVEVIKEIDLYRWRRLHCKHAPGIGPHRAP